ncbi:MAG: GNAT family N-acetyltransferase [Victivallales bacterium]|nr:GNAT family N-acetyltransferase [Victivallales bacterium]
MITLRHFTENDAELLQANQLYNKSKEEILSLINEWKTNSYHGKYFEMFAVVNDTTIVGSISLYEHSTSVASIGVEIFADQRRHGYDADAMRLLLIYAREKGYQIIQQQVRTDNRSSIRLHEKLGFETDEYVYVNKKGHDIILYLKAL